MKKLTINVVAGITFGASFLWLPFQVIQLNAISDKLVVDNRQEITYDKEAEISNYKITTNKDTYYEIKKEAEERRLAKIHQERITEMLAEKEKQRKLEEYRKLREKEKAIQAVSRENTEEGSSDWMTFNASYYTSGCYKCSGISASGVDVRSTIHYNGYRIIAADTKVIPLWSLVEVVTPHESFTAIVLDTGGRIKSRKLDILVKTKSEAYDLGRHDVKLRVIKYGGKNN